MQMQLEAPGHYSSAVRRDFEQPCAVHVLESWVFPNRIGKAIPHVSQSAVRRRTEFRRRAPADLSAEFSNPLNLWQELQACED